MYALVHKDRESFFDDGFESRSYLCRGVYCRLRVGTGCPPYVLRANHLRIRHQPFMLGKLAISD
jgi:hypothetical protein